MREETVLVSIPITPPFSLSSLNFSSRADRNYSDCTEMAANNAQLLEVVRKEVEAAGVEFEVLQPGANVKPSMACYNCLSTGSLRCVMNDDGVNEIIAKCIGKAKRAIIISVSRQMLFIVPLLYTLPQHLGVDGVWYAIPLADTLAALLAAVLLIYQLRKLHKNPSKEVSI